ncbi:DUF736 domain-containing protein [Aquamicrobium sp. NLF2-7]|uniref:DUF736 family protein n=1 Tax=Aquamicrobium sp. NLF2-7 TaxID=2918753 RepID=UPI001EFACC82|nr:DUF736 family protein [Aquamicrobium sp. NLF2-7]MCG8273819.1 DUF736 domain-containing protein [Aquamicrobium sp. NLF2-7]MCG8273971.1 DUF736 domain-containing protein [Aquamicrobium sp. NLF2-7]
MKDLTNYVSIDGDKLSGNVATLAFDIDFKGEPVSSDNPDAPKFRLVAKSPRGRSIEVGALWQNLNREDKPYFSISLETGYGRYYANLGRYPGQDDESLYAVIARQGRGQGSGTD